ncbi:MAG TPA: EpsI family protein [Candidatus Sumerlaeota bacterium]|nr:EpsI family protein [Candidatus Sumerlaeota bacterium]HOR27166.1 EpsI family protein [Candidatus Sumerlaeota bacterium]HPK01506.1 EpsI family protein [Candidatus Sumerlaeota bacterium]
MRSLRVRVAISLVLMGLGAGGSALMLFPTSQVRGSDTAEHLPMETGDWYGQRVPVEEYVKQILETDDVIQRNYINPLLSPVPVQLAVVFSPDNRRVAHPPEVCYRAAGWEAMDKRVIEPAGLPPMMRVKMSYGGRDDLILYCYKAGDELTPNYYNQQLKTVYNQLRMQPTVSALIRFSTAIGEDEAEAEARILALASEMLPHIMTTLQ